MYNLHGIAKRHLACCPRYCGLPNTKLLSQRSTRDEYYTTFKARPQARQRVHFSAALRYASIHTCYHAYAQPSNGVRTLKRTNEQCLNIQDDHYHVDDSKSYENRGYTSGHLYQQVDAHGKPLLLSQDQEHSTSNFVKGIHRALRSSPGAVEQNDNCGESGTTQLSPTVGLGSICSTEDATFTSSFFQDPIKHDTPNTTLDNQSLGEFVPTRLKVDLSHLNLRRRETDTSVNGRAISSPIPSTKFRSNTGLRQVVAQYMKHIDPLIQKNLLSETQTADLHHHLKNALSQQSVQTLQQRGFNVEDIVTWSWILSASSSELSIRRFALLMKQNDSDPGSRIPLFIPLQLLRSPYINATSLDVFISAIEDGLNRVNDWDNDSAAVLLIRLLRHARMVGVRFYDRIVDLAPKVLPVVAKTNIHQDAQRLTHFYNRFLSLIALPLSRHPFLSIDAQQRSQLKIARVMMDSPLRLSLNREGYRALARVQLMHKKTVDEQLWSGVKAPSWPPWRRDELGIDAQIEYPGQQSRVSKVIKRLLEAGYGPESMEHEAKILAGWDIDKSPTIQVRRVTRRRPLAWLKDIFQHSSSQAPDIDHDVWAARVAATRSVREAWVCFYSYMQATMNQKRQLRVYHEMFYKLFARVQHTDQTQSPSPGDGKEVFPNPISLRDHVYVPKEPPSVDELYGQMLQDGLRPIGRLLAGLLDSSHSLERGLEYLRESAIGEVKKDVLLHPEKYPEFAIRKILSTLPDYLLASYIAIFTKRSLSHDVELFWPGSRSVEERGVVPMERAKPLHYCMSLLQIWQPAYMPAYHAMLEGICVQAKSRQITNGTRRARDHSYTELWSMAKHVLELLRGQGLHADLICFRKLVILLRNGMIRAPSQFHHNEDGFAGAVASAKLVFVQALHGTWNVKTFSLPSNMLEIGQQPYWKDVEAMIILLGFGRDFTSIIEVVEWIHREQAQLHCVDAGGYKMQRLTCAIRVALESSWSRNRHSGASRDLVDHAKQQVQQWGWPADIDIEEYLQHHQSWFDGMKAAARD